MACQKVCKQGKDDIIVKVYYFTKPYPYIFLHYSKCENNRETQVLVSLWYHLQDHLASADCPQSSTAPHHKYLVKIINPGQKSKHITKDLAQSSSAISACTPDEETNDSRF